jgi:hypothetical protein
MERAAVETGIGFRVHLERCTLFKAYLIHKQLVGF